MTVSVTTETRHLYISDEAYDVLMHQARMFGYIRGSTAKGLAQYIEFLMTCDMQDNRPPDVQVSDDDMLSVSMAPMWHRHSPRIQRSVKLSQQAMVKAGTHCLVLGIIKGPPTLIGGLSLLDPNRCMSALLEAIGTEWVKVHTNE